MSNFDNLTPPTPDDAEDANRFNTLYAQVKKNRDDIAQINSTNATRDSSLKTRLDAIEARIATLEKPTTTPTPDPPTFARFPGDVKAGRVRWGAAVGGNSDVVSRHETPAGHPLGLHRTFYRGDQTSPTGDLVKMATADIAAGRVPWVSFKPFTGSTWATIGSGQFDSQIDALLRALGALPGSVWLTFNHEPENDTLPAADWRKAQTRIRQRITATGVKNVAFAACLMSYTYHSESGRNPADWWVDGIWDFMGIDHYQGSEASTAPQTHRYWTATVNFLTAKNKLPIALGEWGNRGTDATAAAEMQSFYDYAIASGASTKSQVVGMAYFDSGLNSPAGSWELQGEPLTKFRTLMKDPRSVLINET